MKSLADILNKYFPEYYIDMMYIIGSTDNHQWMVAHGYEREAYRNIGGIKRQIGHVLTKEGKTYLEKADRKLKVLYDQIDNSSLSADDERRAEREAVAEIRAFVNSVGADKAYKGISERTKYACLYLELNQSY